MQSPLETPVQALRNTRRVEAVCAWTTVGTQFLQVLLMPGAAPLVLAIGNGVTRFDQIEIAPLP
jgi:hypothetical protein